MNLKSSTLFQRGLEFKEKLEESNNPLLVKTLDTMGAASDLGSRVAKKVTGESETAGNIFREFFLFVSFLTAFV